MQNSLFTFGSNQIKKFLGGVPTSVSGSPKQALTTISGNFTSMDTVLSEGRIAPEYGEIAAQKLVEAKIAVEQAVLHGWNNGQGMTY